jgi:small subunit ribosomal protein S24e
VEITVLEERPNPLLKRREYRFEVAHATAATPSREAVRGELSKMFKAPKDRVIIERMAARFGTATTRGDAIVYETADAAKLITRAHILVRNGLREKAAKGAAPAGEATAPATPTTPTEAPKPESAPEEAPASRSGHKPEAKPEHKPEPKAEHKPEGKAEHKPEHKSEAKSEAKAEQKPDAKPATHKGEHKAKAPKAEKDETAAKPE